jgi:hypothetical protein
MGEQAARGSGDEYCSTYPTEPHAYVSHSVDAAPLRWVERCHLCGHISSKALREQLGQVPVRVVMKPSAMHRYAAIMRALPRHLP